MNAIDLNPILSKRGYEDKLFKIRDDPHERKFAVKNVLVMNMSIEPPPENMSRRFMAIIFSDLKQGVVTKAVTITPIAQSS